MARKSELLILCFSLLLVLSGCDGPRGETKTLSEVLAGAKQRFAAGLQQGAPSSEAGQHLSGLTTAIEALRTAQSSSEQSRVATEITGHLDSLMGHTGYSTRPSLAELLKQYQKIGSSQGEASESAASINLLVARTYALLARELETTRFQL